MTYIFHAAIALILSYALVFTACQPNQASSESVQSVSAQVADSPTTFYFVRHAEKVTGPGVDPDNPPLTDVGRARAEQLVQVFTEVDLAAVLSPPYIRAINTVAPVAASKDLAVITYDPKLDLRRLADSMLTLHSGEAILIVGLSSTVPGLLNALVHESRYPDLVDGDHDGLYRAVVLPQGAVTVDELRVPLCQ